MHQTTHFFNLGYGWLCKHCSAEETERKRHNHHQPANHKTPMGPALAKWSDEEHHGLTCPRCGIEERLTRAIH